jgi:hypothetical protein
MPIGLVNVRFGREAEQIGIWIKIDQLESEIGRTDG